MSKNTAVILTENETSYWKPVKFALRLVKLGLAQKISDLPLRVRLIPIERIRSTFVPRDCRNFRLEVIAADDKVRSGKPYGITSAEYLEVRRLLRETVINPERERDPVEAPAWP